MDQNDGFVFDFPESEDKPQDIWNTRELVLFAIDCTEPMFRADADGKTLFKLCVKACKSVYMNKIIGMSSDQVGIMFFGTNVNDPGDQNPKHILTFSELKQPDADIIKKIEAMINSENCCDFTPTYGHSDDYALSDVLWHASSLITKSTLKIFIKKIILMTYNDNPHSDSRVKQHQARKKGDDLESLGIELEVIPLGENFDGDLFYNELLKIINKNDSKMEVGVNKIEQMLERIYRKDYKKRSVGKLEFDLGHEVFMGVEFYNFYRPLKFPSIMKLDKKCNEPVKSVRQTYNSETGERLLNSDIHKCIEVSNKRINFDVTDFEKLHINGKPGLTLLGFKSLSSLSVDTHFRASSFLYPTDEVVKGSTALFATLLTQCLNKRKYALCYLISRFKGKPFLVALVPQQEELDDRNSQILPPGFHVVYLPYAENIREIPPEPRSKVSKEQILLCTQIIKKLRFKYTTQTFENPKLQTHWASIEALALNYPKPRDVTDDTSLDYDSVSYRLGALESDFERTFFPLEYDPDVEANKKRKYPQSTERSKIAKLDHTDTEYVQKMVAAGQTEKLTVEVLKNFLSEREVNVKGLKKNDLLNCLHSVLNVK